MSRCSARRLSDFRSYCSPQIWLPVPPSTNERYSVRLSPRWTRRPLRMACTDSSAATLCGSNSLLLYRNTELRALTDKGAMRDKLLMSDSVMPSDKYSTSGLPLSFLNGRTAIDLIAVRAEERFEKIR